VRISDEAMRLTEADAGPCAFIRAAVTAGTSRKVIPRIRGNGNGIVWG